MKAVAYNIKPFEKEFLAKANQKKHDITLIANPLSLDTIIYAEGKDAVIVFANDDVSALVIKKLADLGIKYIVTRSAETDHIDQGAAAAYQIKIANIPSYPLPAEITTLALQEAADQTIKNLDLWQANKCVGDACVCAKNCRALSANKN
ncbi:lactate dehydrogenase [Mucilaginibacter sp. UR6-11]|uniref:lactate dehydrogenase n=1 Tax=Mucilaginibacter sp. UR6-11 TaxID=1435644 RepID=UPI001E2D86F7|nr:lactate dehydrogenase [Mucilaginibacter sp. UR6-11]MCC8424908.1 lactate dehydrogenase [Mucilaginibacter sp. UR6-11]